MCFDFWWLFCGGSALTGEHFFLQLRGGHFGNILLLVSGLSAVAEIFCISGIVFFHTLLKCFEGFHTVFQRDDPVRKCFDDLRTVFVGFLVLHGFVVGAIGIRFGIGAYCLACGCLLGGGSVGVVCLCCGVGCFRAIPGGGSRSFSLRLVRRFTRGSFRRFFRCFVFRGRFFDGSFALRSGSHLFLIFGRQGRYGFQDLIQRKTLFEKCHSNCSFL
nr:MAG TPA: hypothetical protein [Caudoviricetes sp.]